MSHGLRFCTVAACALLVSACSRGGDEPSSPSAAQPEGSASAAEREGTGGATAEPAATRHVLRVEPPQARNPRATSLAATGDADPRAAAAAARFDRNGNELLRSLVACAPEAPVSRQGGMWNVTFVAPANDAAAHVDVDGTLNPERYDEVVRSCFEGQAGELEFPSPRDVVGLSGARWTVRRTDETMYVVDFAFAPEESNKLE